MAVNFKIITGQKTKVLFPSSVTEITGPSGYCSIPFTVNFVPVFLKNNLFTHHASIITATPEGLIDSYTANAICFVSLS